MKDFADFELNTKKYRKRSSSKQRKIFKNNLAAQPNSPLC
jgi:hypothetical protein